MKTILLIRHAHTAMEGRFCGHSNPELSPDGRNQLPHIVQQLNGLAIDRILSSDLRRAHQTAHAIAHLCNTPVELRPALREIHFGAWEGLAWNEVEAQFPQHAHTWMKDFPIGTIPGGETYPDFLQRIDREFLPLLTNDAQETTAVVTHRGVMRAALVRYFQFSEQQAHEITAPYGTVIPLFIPQIKSQAPAESQPRNSRPGEAR